MNMFRLRKPSGEVVVPDEAMFVELCDSDGNVVFVLLREDYGYRIIGHKDSTERKRYEKLYGVKFVEHKELEL